MRLTEYINEIMDLDKGLKGIIKPNNITWVFHIDGIKFRVYITELSTEVNQQWYKGIEVILQRWNDGWTTDYQTFNNPIIGGRIISIVYDIITKHKPRVFTMRAYHHRLSRLYDVMWLRHSKSPPFNKYTKYKKNVLGMDMYSFVNMPNIQEDDYMMNNYMNLL